MTDEADAELVGRLRRTPLYHGHGEESNLPEEAADAIERLMQELSTYRDHLMPLSEQAYREMEARVEAAEAELTAVAGAIGTVEFMDPPDGGDVPLSEQVSRMAELAQTRGMLEPRSIKRSTIVFLCCQSQGRRGDGSKG